MRRISSPTWSQVALHRLLVEHDRRPRRASAVPRGRTSEVARRRAATADRMATLTARLQSDGDWSELARRARAAGGPLAAAIALEDEEGWRPRLLLLGWLWETLWRDGEVPGLLALPLPPVDPAQPSAAEREAEAWRGVARGPRALAATLAGRGLERELAAIEALASLESAAGAATPPDPTLLGGLLTILARRALRGGSSRPVASAVVQLVEELRSPPGRSWAAILRALSDGAAPDEGEAELRSLLELTDLARRALPPAPTPVAQAPRHRATGERRWRGPDPGERPGVDLSLRHTFFEPPLMAEDAPLVAEEAPLGQAAGDDLEDDAPLEQALGDDLEEEAALPAPQAGAPEAPPAHTLNLGLSADGQTSLDRARPVPEGWLHALVQVGPPTPWSAVRDPTPLPDDISAAIAEEGGEDVEVALSSPDFEIEGAAPAPEGEWQVLERALYVPARGPTQRLALRIRPRRPGRQILRVALYFRGALAQAARLQVMVGDPATNPSYEARIEYTAAPGLAALRALEPRALSLWINDVAGSHALGVRSGASQVSRALSLRPDQLGPLAAAARAALVEAGSLVENDQRRYRFAETPGRPANTGTPEALRASLLGLARLGYGLYGELLPQDLRGALVPALRAPTTISVARLADGEVLPWALIYDRRLDLDAVTTDDVCLRLIPGGGQPVVEPGACRARPDCPLNDPERARRTICPWAFWGFKHAVEQPAQRVEPGQQPRPLVTEIQGPVRLDMNVYPGFPRLPAHRPRVEALADQFIYAGDDRAPGAPPARQGVRAALADRDLTAIYFYCHGGEVLEDGLMRPYLAVGRNRERLRPIELGENDDDTGAPVFQWPRHPLVLLNGCETAAIEPRVLMHFVDAFANAGAAGVIGTEVPVWEALATEVGEGFLRRFLQEGSSVGAAMRATRLDLLARYNPLGLVYTVYASADLRLVRG